jgi:hypothetical protein
MAVARRPDKANAGMIDFDNELQNLGLTAAQLEEMRVAYAQSPLGFELVLSRARGARTPVAALLSAVRQGAHLKAGGEAELREQRVFTCRVCGKLPSTNAAAHYGNFPEHELGAVIGASDDIEF